MNDSLAVNDGKRGAEPLQDAQCVVKAGAEPIRKDPFTQRSAFDELHGHPGHTAVDAVLMNSNDSGVTNSRQGADFAAKTREQRPLEGPDRLHRRDVAGLDVLRAIDNSHAAVTELVEQPVGAGTGRTGRHPMNSEREWTLPDSEASARLVDTAEVVDHVDAGISPLSLGLCADVLELLVATEESLRVKSFEKELGE